VMLKQISTALVLMLMATLSPAAEAATPAVNTLKAGLFGGHGEVAILGYDPVGYFLDGKPEPGSDTYTYVWQGAKWKFASQDHLDKFRAEPGKYAPQYGGYCAYGVAKDNLVSIEPDKWTIIGGKLYLNYDADVQQKWLKDPTGYIQQADGKFTELLKK